MKRAKPCCRIHTHRWYIMICSKTENAINNMFTNCECSHTIFCRWSVEQQSTLRMFTISRPSPWLVSYILPDWEWLRMDRCYRCLTYWLTHWQTLKDRATQLLIKYKSGALVTQLHNECLEPLSHEVIQKRAFDWLLVLFHCRFWTMDRFRSQFTLKCIGLSSEHRVFFCIF